MLGFSLAELSEVFIDLCSILEYNKFDPKESLFSFIKGTKMDKIKLTPRETEVLNLLMTRGCSNKVIAKLMDLSESTIKLHMGNILHKYGARNRTQLVVFVQQSIR